MKYVDPSKRSNAPIFLKLVEDLELLEAMNQKYNYGISPFNLSEDEILSIIGKFRNHFLASFSDIKLPVKLFLHLCTITNSFEYFKMVLSGMKKLVKEDYYLDYYPKQDLDYFSLFTDAESIDIITFILITLKDLRIAVKQECFKNPETLLNLGEALQNLKKYNCLTAEFNNLISSMCKPENQKFADIMAKAIIEFKWRKKLTDFNMCLIQEYPANCYAIARTFTLLEKARLNHMDNCVYVIKENITDAVPAILQKLDEAKPCLLNMENVKYVFDNIKHAEDLLNKLPHPLTAEKFCIAQNEVTKKEEKSEVSVSLSSRRMA